MYNLNLTVKKASDNPKSRDVLQNNWYVIFRSIRTMKVKMVSHSRLNEAEHAWQLNPVQDFGLEFLNKKYDWKNRNHLKRAWLFDGSEWCISIYF